MPTVFTPRDLIAKIAVRGANKKSFSFYSSPLQKYLFHAAWFSISVGLGLGIYFQFNDSTVVAIAAIACAAFGELLAVIYQLTSLVPEIAKLKDPEADLSNSLQERFNDELDLLGELARSGLLHQLEYARDSFELSAKQMRERIGILVGALDKVGVIPLLITAYVSYLKFKKDGFDFSGVEFFSIAFAALYLMAIRMTTAAQWLERTAAMFEQARRIRVQSQQH